MENTSTDTLTVINHFLEGLVGHVWGLPLIFALVGTGLYFSIRLKGIQWRAFRHAIVVVTGKFDKETDPGQITHFQALCTALSATVGLGNIAGVAVAVHFGGPGAVFWMIVTGLVGMATKFAECTLSVMYRQIDEDGTVRGGPMHYILGGLGEKFRPLALFFSFAIMCSAFGAGNMFQTNQVAAIMNANFNFPVAYTGIALAILTVIAILGGITRIASVTSKIVPLMAAIYVGGCLIIIISHIGEVPALFGMIFNDAFTGTAAAGGFAGIALRQVLVQGVKRASFSNEAGQGTAPIAHSTVKTSEPVREGCVALLEPFVDTVVICTMTALVILISGVPYWETTGIELTALAFDASLPGFGTYFIPIAVFLFAYSTLISWAYYGETGFSFFFGERKTGLFFYKILFCTLSFVGAVWKIEPVINFSDIMLGLLVIPNLFALFLLRHKIFAAADKYFKKMGI